MIPSQVCVDLVKQYEGYRDTSYQDTGGVWTIGYGTTRGVAKGQTIRREDAESRLHKDLIEASNDVIDNVQCKLNQNQFDALCSFVYNIGGSQFRNSTMLKMLNGGHYSSAAQQFTRWNKDNGVVLAGLTKRRLAERTLFEKQ